MFKSDIEATHPKSVKSKKQIEINIIVNQNKEYEGKNKFKRRKKKWRKAEMTEIPVEPSDTDECHDPKRAKRKKSKSKRSNIGEEEQNCKIEKITSKSPRESEIDKDVSDGLKKKRKKNVKPDDVSDPQNISERCKRNICEEEPSRVQGESEGNKKKKRKNNVDMEEGLFKNIKTSSGTPDKVCKTLKISCIAEVSKVKKRKKRKESHSIDTNTSEDEKPMKKWKRDRNVDEPEAGSDKLKVADSRRQKDEQKLDTLSNTTDRTHAKKRKKEKLHIEEPERTHKGEILPVEMMMKKVEQVENEMEYSTKSGKKRKRLIEAEGEGIAILDRERLKLNTANSVGKLQNFPVTTKGKKQKTAFNVGESIETEIKRKRKEISSGKHVCKVKEELCDDDDLLIMSEKKGNIFEVKIDKARRQALQEEIDRESGKTGTLKTKVSPEIKPRCMGTQWDTATFETTEQKNKFLRLMGGFKSSNPPQSSSSGKHNMAPNRDQEEKFNRTMQKEFDRALDFQQHRGIGLDFIPLSSRSNKTFFIDKHASKSTKFHFN